MGPESFSLASAERCVQAIFDAVPKSRRALFIGELNEVLVVLSRVPSMDRDKEFVRPIVVTEVDPS